MEARKVDAVWAQYLPHYSQIFDLEGKELTHGGVGLFKASQVEARPGDYLVLAPKRKGEIEISSKYFKGIAVVSARSKDAVQPLPVAKAAAFEALPARKAIDAAMLKSLGDEELHLLAATEKRPTVRNALAAEVARRDQFERNREVEGNLGEPIAERVERK